MIPVKDNIETDRTPVVAIILVALNIVVYLTAVIHHGAFISGPAPHELAFVPNAPSAGTMLTSLFVQGSIAQLIGNLLFLWIFGSTLEDAMGPVRFIAFYLAGGLVALGLQTAFDPGATTPVTGAAGAVATVIGGYLRLYPHGRVLSLMLIVFFFGVVEVPALVMLGIWLIMQAVFDNGVRGYLAEVVMLGAGLATAGWLAPWRKATPPTAAAYR